MEVFNKGDRAELRGFFEKYFPSRLPNFNEEVGTGDIFGPQYNANRTKLRELKDYVKLYGERGPESEPGAEMEYSNYGYILLGVLIDRVSGQSYYDYVREHVFKPAGMTRTDSLSEDEPVPDRAVGYMKRDGEWKPNSSTLPYRGTSAGGGYSTVEGLLRFANALPAANCSMSKTPRL